MHSQSEVDRSLSVYHSIGLDPDDGDAIDVNYFTSTTLSQLGDVKSLYSERTMPVGNTGHSSPTEPNNNATAYNFKDEQQASTDAGLPRFSFKNRFSLEDAVFKLRELDKEDNLTRMTQSYKYRGSLDDLQALADEDDIDVDSIIINGYSSLTSESPHHGRQQLSAPSSRRTSVSQQDLPPSPVGELRASELSSRVTDVIKRESIQTNEARIATSSARAENESAVMESLTTCQGISHEHLALTTFDTQHDIEEVTHL